MINKKILFNIYISILSICILFLITFFVLGNKTRIGYLSDFNLNIDKTLESNGFNIYNTKKLFIIDNKLDTDSLINYIYTNETITNYIYGFRIKYYSKVFRNSDIYGVFIDNNKIIQENNFIKEIKMNDDKGTPFGNLISSKKIDFDKIDNIHYTLKLNNDIYISIVYIILLKVYVIFFIFIFNCLKSYLKYKKTLNDSDYIFVYKLEFITILLFIFNFLLIFPGNFNYEDTLVSMIEGINFRGNNWHPRIIGIFLGILYRTIGIHSYYILFLNLFLWYTAIFILIVSIYLKYKNKFVLFLLLLSFLSDIFFFNMNHVKDSTATLFVFFSYTLLLSSILIHRENNNSKLLTYVVFFTTLIIGMLWRHNFIVTVYPMFIFITYKILENKKITKHYYKYFLSLMIVFAILLIIIFKSFPIVTKSYKAYPENIVYIFDIASCAVPENDDSMIPTDWYRDGKNFEDVKNIYNKFPLYGDPLCAPWFDDSPFLFDKLYDVKNVLIKYILKYPNRIIEHKFNFAKATYTQKNLWKFNVNQVQVFDKEFAREFLEDKVDILNIKFSPLQSKIYDILYHILPEINILFFILLTLLLFIITFLLIILKRELINELLIFSFSTSFSSLSTSIIVPLFSPSAMWHYRYIYPVVPIIIISLVSSISFIYDIGGIKVFVNILKKDLFL